jgi:uncharacterized protein with PQ loop repeat
MLDNIAVSIGGILIVSSWLPQIAKLLKTKSSKDISLKFLLIVTLGTLLLIPHSFAIEDTFFIIINCSAGSISFTTLMLARYYRNKEKQ